MQMQMQLLSATVAFLREADIGYVLFPVAKLCLCPPIVQSDFTVVRSDSNVSAECVDILASHVLALRTLQEGSLNPCHLDSVAIAKSCAGGCNITNDYSYTREN